jgi:predicted enzyme related to lactoylglutathione lyase
MKIGMTSVFVPDPIKAYKFYTEVLGFAKKLYIPEHWLAIVTSPEDPNGTSLMLEPNHNSIAKNYQEALYKSAIPCIVFSADDIQKEYERLKEKGVVFKNPPKKTDYGIEAIFEDTFGNLIQLVQAEG